MKKRYLVFAFVLEFLCFGLKAQNDDEVVHPSTVESLSLRATPQWFNDAKLGIFIHWGLYSVPAWATPTTTPDKVTDWKEFYRSNPYAEWYLNSLRIDGSPTQQHHKKTFGKEYDYYNFCDSLRIQSAGWNADTWAEIFAQTGARYVVLTTKHHDGYTLYPSKVTNPFMSASQINSQRDYVGELCLAVRKQGLKFGTYYSGGLDWTFNQIPVTNLWPDLFESMPVSEAYAQYANAHLFELIRNYSPDILWNDVNYPKKGNFPAVVRELVRLNPLAVVNDRWQQHPELYDFTTPEYQVMDSIVTKKWETCRGLGYSFGYNQVETDVQLLSSGELIHLLIDIVSKNGNLLLNVGPKADGTIPENQLSRLNDLGDWLEINGEGIFGTTPYVISSARLEDGTDIRFTQKGNDTFIFFLSQPKTRKVIIPLVNVTESSHAALMSNKSRKIPIRRVTSGIELRLPVIRHFQFAQMIRVRSDR